MAKQIDLHVHTTASDGLYSPTEIVQKAKKLGLVAIGIADHDTIGGIREALTAGEKYGLEVVPGVEITNYWSAQNRREFHTLGYYFDLENQKLNQILKHYQQVRIDRAKKIVRRLQSLGFAVTYPQVEKIAGGTIGRPHPARAVLKNPKNKKLLEKIFGHRPDISEFIEAYIIESKPAFVEKAGLEPDETIRLIHQAGGLAVLAHPGWNLKINEENVIDQFADWGIDGLETIHGKRTKEETLKSIAHFSKLAKKYRLLITGGSDFHADKENEPGHDLGLLKWQIKIPYRLLEKMKMHRTDLC